MKSLNLLTLAAASVAAVADPYIPTCEDKCCDSASWRYGKDRKHCDWVGEKRTRCFKFSEGVAATEACPVACGTCSTFTRIVELEEQLAATNSSQACDATFAAALRLQDELADVQNDLVSANSELAAAEAQLVSLNSVLVASNGLLLAARDELADAQESLEACQDPTRNPDFETQNTILKAQNTLLQLRADAQCPEGEVALCVQEPVFCSTDAPTPAPTPSPTVSLAPTISAAPTEVEVENPPLPQIVECLRSNLTEGDHCKTCCPACTAVVGTSSFESNFVQNDDYWASWYPIDDSRCICLDFAEDGYQFSVKEGIHLTSFSDCARITADGNYVYGDPIVSVGGNDAMYSNGVGIILDGMGGDDHIVMGGTDGYILGADGSGDVCTDISGSNTIHSECEDCFGPGGKCDSCEACNPPLPEIVECLQNDTIAEGDHCKTCCPACTAVVGLSSFKSHFVNHGEGWEPVPGFTGCVCLDFAADEYDIYQQDPIGLTSSSDCARITGNENFVSGGAGDDAMYSNGVGNKLNGYHGDDHLVMDGSEGAIWGGDGSGDVCTELSGSNTIANDCEDKLTHTPA